MTMHTAPEARRPTPDKWTALLAWASLATAAPLMAAAAWFAYDAATSTSEWALLGLLVTVAIAVPVVPAIALALAALRSADSRRARRLAVTAALLIAAVPLLGVWLGLS